MAIVRLSVAPQQAPTFEFEASVINSHSDRERLMMTRRVMAIYNLPVITRAFVERTDLKKSPNRTI